MADAGYSTPPGIELRFPTVADAPQIAALATDVFGPGPERDQRAVTRRMAHTIERCHSASRVAVEPSGRIVGATLVSPRGHLLILSLAIVAGSLQGQGLGRAMLAPFPAARAGTNRVVMSSTDPKAMRRYVHLGLAAHPCLAGCGILRPGAVQRPTGAERCTPLEGAAILDAIGAEARGEPYGDDVAIWDRLGDTLHLVGEDAAAIRSGGVIRILVARSQQAATAVLQDALDAVPPGETVHIRHVRAGQDWAIREIVRARLELSPDGAFFSDTPLGVLHLPTGSVL